MTAAYAFLTSNTSLTPSFNETNPGTTLAESLRPIHFSSGISIAVLSFVATFGNGFLLLAIWKDPYRTFRIPSTVFVIGLATADFLTGFLVGPLIAYIRISSPDERKTYRFIVILQAGQTLSFLTMNASYLVLLFLTWNQFAAIRFPHKHRNVINTRKVSICVAAVWVYAILFSLLPFSGIDADIFNKLDFYMHTAVFLVLLIIAYSCLFIAFQNQVQRITLATTHHSVHGAHSFRIRRSRRRSEKQFTIVALVLVTFVILCTLPSFILQFLNIYWKPPSFEGTLSMSIALEISSDVLFLKFALDPFIYCWRLTSYRRALKTVLKLGRVSPVGREHVFSITKTATKAQTCERAIGVSLISRNRRESYMISIQQNHHETTIM